MLLKRLELLGFKSFANRVVLEFEPGISALVGPNGSGKSNVADAVRWVMGEQSARALRGRKAEEVIFVGSNGRAPLGMAEAALVLDNSSRQLSVDFAEVRLARRLYRSGESEYLINGARSRRRDLVALLLEVGLHSEGYTVIGQGAVEELVMQRPDERRLVLEHAADITRHQTRLSEARSRLAAAEQNLARSQDLIAELEPHARRLRTQADRAERHATRRAELAALAGAYYRALLAEQQAAQQTASLQLERASATVDRLDANIATEEEGRQTGRVALRALEADLAGLRSEQERLNQERARLLGELADGRQRSGFLEARCEALVTQDNRVQTALSEMESEQRALPSPSQRGLEPDLQEALDGFEREVERLTTELNQTRRSSEQARQQQARVAWELRQLERDQQAQRERTAREQQARAEATTRRTVLEQRLAENTTQASKREAEISAAREQLAHASHRLAAVGSEREAAASQLAEARRVEHLLGADLEVGRAAWHALVEEVDLVSGQTPGAGATRLAALLDLPPDLELAVAAALGEWAGAELLDGAGLIDRPLERNGASRTLFLLTDDKGGLQRLADRLADRAGPALAPLHARLASQFVGSAASETALAPGPLAFTFIVEDFATAQDAARRLRHATDLPWQVVTRAGEVLSWFGGLARGAESAAERLVSLRRRMTSSKRRVSQSEAATEQAAMQSARLQRELGELEQRERELQTADLSARSDLRMLVRGRDDLAAERARLEQDLVRMPPLSPSTIAPSDSAAEDERSRLELVSAELNRHEAAAAESLESLQTARERAWADRDQARRRVDQQAAERRARLEVDSAREREMARLRRELESARQQLEALLCEQASLGAGLASLSSRLAEVEAAVAERGAEVEAAAARRLAAQRSVDGLEARLSDLRRCLSQARARRESALLADQQASDLLARSRQEAEATADEWNLGGLAQVQLRLFSSRQEDSSEQEEPFLEIDLIAARRRLQALQRELRAEGTTGEGILEEYHEVEQRLRFLGEQSTDLRASMQELYQVIAELEGLMRSGFGDAFASVNAAFTSTFAGLFGGGTARLVLTDPSDVLRTGVDIVAQPPGKRLQSLMSLSGGERALTATALIFALLAINPLPFCVLDEVDAALDESNARRFATLLRQYAERTQFIIITHNRATMETAETLYGISMGGDGVTAVLSLRPAEALAEAANGSA